MINEQNIASHDRFFELTSRMLPVIRAPGPWRHQYKDRLSCPKVEILNITWPSEEYCKMYDEMLARHVLGIRETGCEVIVSDG